MRRLSFEEIRPILVGAVEIEERANGIHARKCTKKQIEAWEKEDPFLGITSRATSGIRLEFLTDSKRMRFAFSCGTKVELLIDGMLRAQYDMSVQRDLGEPLEVLLTDSRLESREELQVTLTFPSHDDPGVLELLELDDGAYVKPCTYDRKILFYGDSITQGWASEIDSDSYAYRVSRFFRAESVIQGIGGGIFLESTLDRIAFDPDIIVIAFGTNDATRENVSLESFAHNVRAVLNFMEAEYAGKKIFVISPIWRGHSDGRPMEESFVAYRTLLEHEVASRNGLILIPGLELMPPMPRYYQDRYLHPNDLGFAVYAERLIERMQRYL